MNNNFDICMGQPEFLGANRIIGGVQFALQAEKNDAVSLLLYKKGSSEVCEEIPFPSDFQYGKIRSVMVKGLNTEHYEYNYRINGAVVQDPCTYGICGREVFGAPLEEEEHKIRCRFLPHRKYDWKEDTAPDLPYDQMILYKLHVRGFTKTARISPRKRGTFAGLKEMIPYLKELGINAVELMPAYEFAETGAPMPKQRKDGMILEKKESERVNFWGYVPGFYFAPKRSYCATKEPEKEFRDMVAALHEAGIECIMEMYFPDGTPPLLALESLWFWKRYYHVDGFHLSGTGVPVQLICEDGLLYGTKRMFDGVNTACESSEMLAEYNPGFLQDMRRFLKSDEGMLSAVEFHIRRNTGRFGTINYMAGQDGFTLYDTVSYNYRHNEANGEENRDGSDFNYSWNCGVEGASRKIAVKRLREQQLRNAYLLLLLSQGTPMIYAGDEFGNSQDGNNNAWCQDNETGWTDWKALRRNEGLSSFVKKAIAFRREHPILHLDKELRGVDYLAMGFPDVSLHGERAWYLSKENTNRLLGIMYCGFYAKKADGEPDDFFYIGYNFHWENRELALPNLPDGMQWVKLADTADADPERWFQKDISRCYNKKAVVTPRSIIILTATKAIARKQEVSEHAFHASVASLQNDHKA